MVISSSVNANNYNNRYQQLCENDVFGSVGKEIDDKNWLPKGKPFGNGEIYPCKIFVNGKELQFSNEGVIKINGEFYISSSESASIISFIKDKSEFIRKNSIEISKVDFDQVVNGKGVKLKIQVEYPGMFGKTLKTVYFHLESYVELATCCYFYTNRLFNEMYVVSKQAVRLDDYGLVIYDDDGYVKNLKMQKLFIARTGEEITTKTVLKKIKTDIKCWFFPESGSVGMESLNKVDEALENVELYLTNVENNGLLVKVLVHSVAVTAVRAGTRLGQAGIKLRKREFLQSLLALEKSNKSIADILIKMFLVHKI